MNRLFLLLLLVFSFTAGFSQNPLDAYLESAMKKNIVLQEKHISLEQARNALKTAKSLFYPTLHLQGDYITARGGRDALVPVGDMFNPIVDQLNDLTQMGIPHLENQRINFLPQNFYDLKFQVKVPIYNRQMLYNKKIREKQVRLSEYELDVYKRDLIEDVKTAYYHFFQAGEAVAIYKASLDLAREGKRVNEKLLENGKAVPAYLLRAESEIEELKAQIVERQYERENAKRYFNFLLNRDPDMEILGPDQQTNASIDSLVLRADKGDFSNRDELAQIDELLRIRENVLELDRSAFFPSLNGFVDIGSQAEDWAFDSHSQYFMVGLSLKVPLYEGNRKRLKLESNQLAMKEIRLKREDTEDKLRLDVTISLNNLRTAYQNLLSARKSLEATKAYHRLIDKGYKAGVNSYIETVDARSQLTRATLAENVRYYAFLAAVAKWERATASYPLN